MKRWSSLFGSLFLVSGCAMAAKPIAPWDSFRINNAYAIFVDKKAAELAVAGAKGDTLGIDRLLAQGVNINTVGEFGETPLFWALYAHNKAGFQKLLENGADPNARDENGDGVIHLAAEDEDSDFLRLALANRGDPNLGDKRGVFPTPIFRALQPIPNDNLQMLIAHGADINYRTAITRDTPMIAAGNKYDKVYLLIQAGADFRLADSGGHTIVRNIEHNMFDKNGYLGPWRDKVIAFLREHGVEVHPRNP